MLTDLLTARQAAEALQVSEQTVRRWARDGQLPSVKLGRLRRFPRSAIEGLASEGFGPTSAVGAA